MFYLCYMCLLANSDAKYVAIMSVRWRVSYKRQGLLTIREHLSSVCLFVFLLVCLILFLLCFLLCFVRLRSVSCVLNIDRVSGLPIFFCTFGFLSRLVDVSQTKM